MEIGKIKQRMRAVRANTVELAEYMGVTYKQADDIVNARRKKLTADEERAITRFLEARENPGFEAPEPRERGSGVESAAARAEIPLYGGDDTQKGWMLSLIAGSQVGRVMAHPRQATVKRAFAVEVVDDTMAPRLRVGEICYVAGGKAPERGQDCLVEFPDMTARILQFVERNDKRVVFQQLNPSKEVILSTEDAFKVHAIVGRG